MRNIGNQRTNNKHDKTFKIVLENKEEVANLINRVIEFEKRIKAEELEKYNKNFITQNLKIQEADIVYKIKNRNIYFLIEHQTKIDYSMAYRILNYQIEIMRSSVDQKRIKNKEYKHALVISMVLYTGSSRWTAKNNIKEMQEKIKIKNAEPMIENYYYILDINDYTKKELLEEKSFLSKIMLLEKSKSSEELVENLEEINPKLKSEEKETLKRILIYALEEYLEEEKLEQIINKMNKGGEEEMLAMVEMLKREKQTDIARGKSEGAAQRTVKLAKRMLKEKLDIEMIEKITGLKREKFM